MNLPLLRDAGDLRGKRVLLRLDLDLPLEQGRLEDAHRINRARKTLDFLKNGGAKTLIIGHVGRDPKETLRPIGDYLRTFLPIVFAEGVEVAKEKLRVAEEGTFVLLENLRSFKGETENDPTFARALAALADVYVNEAFAVSHREHASIALAPKLLKSFAGFVFAEEVQNLSKAFTPTHPALLILGGAKFETKTPLIKRFLGIVDDVYVSGALANDIYRARGYETGVSLVSSYTLPDSILRSPKLHVPSDVIVRTLHGPVERGPDTLEENEKIVDAGSDALSDLRVLVEKAAFVLWNGTLGEYEAGFDQGTIALAQMLAECDAETIIGGGDSLAVVSKLGLLERFSFVSTGGGAMLEFLANETLPGIQALQKQARNGEL